MNYHIYPVVCQTLLAIHSYIPKIQSLVALNDNQPIVTWYFICLLHT